MNAARKPCPRPLWGSLPLTFLILCLPGVLVVPVAAGPPRVLPPGELPADARLGELTNLNGYFPFSPPQDLSAWHRRAAFLRRQLRAATGLWPMPTRTPAHAVIHDPVDRGDYTVAKVYLQSFPGHYVTGNLYRPKGKQGKLPGVLCPHGHWPNGRFYDAGEEKLRKQIASGAEKYDPSGRYPIQARCAKLARMGCVVFNYDMVGYADSVQLSHRPGLRQSMNTPQNWGYFSPQAELRMENMMGLQTYNSIRALDWFRQLPQVDPGRIAVTGSSGGGTQTFILCAIDERPAVAFPAVMVSTAMQGGCTCENACYLRVESGNIEIAALIAPRPLGMTAADDWTKEIATKGLPQLQALYKLFDAEQLVKATPLVQFPHNYNYQSRAVMYDWLNRHLGLGLSPAELREEDFQPLTRDQLTVWDDHHPQPAGGEQYERDLLKWITQDSRRQMDRLLPKDPASLAEFRRVVGGAVEVMIGRKPPQPAELEPIKRHDENRGDYVQSAFLIANPTRRQQVPALLLKPKDWNNQVAVWVDPRGKAAAFEADGSPAAPLARLLKTGTAVLAIDLFGQGEFTPDGKPIDHARLNASGHGDWAAYAGYTFGYNHPVFSKRVHDILSAVAFARHPSLSAEKVYLVGWNGAGRWVAAALAVEKNAVDRAVVDTAGFRFAGLTRFDDPDFLPGAVKYLDLPGMLALAAPAEVWLAGEGNRAPDVVQAAFQAAGQPHRLTVFSGQETQKEKAAIDWLLR